MKKMKKKYPGWRYHKTLSPVLVKSQDEEDQLEEGFGPWAAVFGEAPKPAPKSSQEPKPIPPVAAKPGKPSSKKE